MTDEEEWDSFLDAECWNRERISEALLCYGQLEYVVKRFIYEVRTSIGKYLGLKTSGYPHSDPDVLPIYDEDGDFSFFITCCKFMYSEIGVDLRIRIDDLVHGPEVFFQKWKEAEEARGAEKSVERERDLREYENLKRKWGFE